MGHFAQQQNKQIIVMPDKRTKADNDETARFGCEGETTSADEDAPNSALLSKQDAFWIIRSIAWETVNKKKNIPDSDCENVKTPEFKNKILHLKNLPLSFLI